MACNVQHTQTVYTYSVGLTDNLVRIISSKQMGPQNPWLRNNIERQYTWIQTGSKASELLCLSVCVGRVRRLYSSGHTCLVQSIGSSTCPTTRTLHEGDCIYLHCVQIFSWFCSYNIIHENCSQRVDITFKMCNPWKNYHKTPNKQ